MGACLLVLLMNWSFVPRITEAVPALGFGDPYVQAWHVSWEGHILRHDPSEFFQSNAFWPLNNALAFEDALIGYAPAGLIGEGPETALLRYNLLFLFAQALPFIGAYLLAREMGLGWLGSAAAGIAFAFAPWRLDQGTHLNVLSSGGIPLTLFLLLRAVKRKSPGYALAGWAVAIWQLSLGFSLGIQFAYLLFALGALWIIHFKRSGAGFRTRFMAAVLGGGLLFVAWGAFQGAPYLQVREAHPEAERTQVELELYSPPPRSFLAASETNVVWGGATRGIRRTLPWPSEQTLFPGVAVVLATAVGVGWGALSRRTRISLLAASIGLSILSLGTSLGFTAPIYNAMRDVLPGWDAIRTPGRLMASVSLGIAVLAGAGIDRMWKSPAPVPGRPGRRVRILPVIALSLVAVLGAEGAGRLQHNEASSPPTEIAALPEPVLFLPSDDIVDRVYMFWSIDGFPRMPNGAGSFVPTELAEFRQTMHAFPDQASVAQLQELGIETVVLDRRLARFTPWETTADKPVEGLDLERIDGPDAVIYRIGDSEVEGG